MAEGFRALEGERAEHGREGAELRQQAGQAANERDARQASEQVATAALQAQGERAAAEAGGAAQAAEALEHARRRVAEFKEQETHARAARRQAEEAVAQVAARRDALAELERERGGPAPGAQALLKVRAQFGDTVIGPLSGFVRTCRPDAALAERPRGQVPEP